MPTYDYTCDACDHAWELIQKMSDKPVRKCPSCGKQKARRLIGAGAGLIFKGSGFYVTDYKKSGASGDKGNGEQSGEKKSGGGKSDAPTGDTSGGKAPSAGSGEAVKTKGPAEASSPKASDAKAAPGPAGAAPKNR